MKKTIVVFAPHPDDETLACGGTMAMYRRAHHDVYVVFMTDGSYSHLENFGTGVGPTPKQLRDIRYAEARAATSILGVEETRLTFLDFEDGTLQACLKLAKAKVHNVLRRLKPDEVISPSAEDRHADHQATNVIVGASVRSVCPRVCFRKYTIWSYGKQPFIASEGVVVDISDVLAVKKKALSQYKSQTTRFFASQPRPILSRVFLRNFLRPVEVFTDE